MTASCKLFNVFIVMLFVAVMATPSEARADKISVKKFKRVIGLVEIPSLFGVADPHGPPGSRLPFTPGSVSVYQQPDYASTEVTVINNPKDIAISEYNYEQTAALVYERKDHWYLVGIDHKGSIQHTWLRQTDAGRYHSLESLLKQFPSYLTSSWNMQLAQTPDDHVSTYNGKARDIRIIDKRVANNVTWFNIELLQPGPCSATPSKVVAKGWIPATTTDGRMNVWFHSRGC